MKKVLHSKHLSINESIADNRLLALLHEKVISAPYFDQELCDTIKQYIVDYLASNDADFNEATTVYMRFIQSYNKDMKVFAKKGLYPLEINPDRAALERFEYDIVLLFSCIFALHRFRIMQLIRDLSKQEVAKGLVIGCGPGLEIELIKAHIQQLHVYDLKIDKFLYDKHNSVDFNATYFTGKNDNNQYNCIYLIELLEHLAEPYELLKNCAKVLSKNGKIYLTTATNIPQFDHLYNFEASHKDFEQQVDQLGLQIAFMEDIKHQTITLDIDARNRFYVLKRK